MRMIFFLISASKNLFMKCFLASLVMIFTNIYLATTIKIVLDNPTSIQMYLFLKIFVAILLVDFLNIIVVKYRAKIQSNVVTVGIEQFLYDVSAQGKKVDTGYLLTILGNDVNNLGKYASELWRTLIPGILSLLGLFLFLMFRYDLLFSCIVLTSVFISILLPIVLKPLIKKSYQQSQDDNDRLNSSVSDFLDHFMFLKMLRIPAALVSSISHKMKQASLSSAKSSIVMLTIYSISFNSTILPITSIAISMYFNIVVGSVGDFFELVWIIQVFSIFILGIPSAIYQHISSQESFDRIKNIKFVVDSCSAKADFKSLSGTYKDNLSIFHNAPSLLITSRGFGNCVSKEDWVLAGSVAENVSLSAKPDIGRVEQALAFASFSLEEISAQSVTDNIIDRDGLNLSTGQRSRLLLARAIYNRKKHNLIHNLFSNLDSDNIYSILSKFNSMSDHWIIIESSNIDPKKRIANIRCWNHATS